MADVLPHFIAGHFVAGDAAEVHERRNPSNPTDLVATFSHATAAEVAKAVDAARTAGDSWRKLPGPARADALYRWGEAIAARGEEIAQAMAREVGKPISEARGEVARATVICRYYAGEAVREVGEVIPSQTADTLQFTLRDPVGVVGLITPWNFPLAIPLWKTAPALAFGNTVVLKPSELSPRVSHLLAETALAAQLPAGVFNVIHGAGATGAALIEADGVRAISFTGSQAVGARVAASASARNIRVQTEMGGKNVVIVARDADLDRAAALTAAGAMRYAGQKCTATSRVIVDRAVEAAFIERLDTVIASYPLGPVDDPKCAIGPLITPESHTKVSNLLDAHSAEVVSGGQLPNEGFSAGNWFAPRVIRLDSPAHPLALTELFAPVLGLLAANDLDDAITQANASPFGMSASLFTGDLRSAMTYVRRIEAGLVRVNGDTTGVDPHAPFGGMKSSSSGSREQGRAARDFYTEIRTIQIHS